MKVRGQVRKLKKGPLLAHWWGFGPWGQNTHTHKSLMKLKKNLERPLYWDLGTKMLLLELELRLEHGTRTIFRVSRPKVQ